MALTSIEISKEKKKMIFAAGMTLNGVFERGFQKIFVDGELKRETEFKELNRKVDMYARIAQKLQLRVTELEERNNVLEKETRNQADELGRIRKTFKKNSRGAE